MAGGEKNYLEGHVCSVGQRDAAVAGFNAVAPCGAPYRLVPLQRLPGPGFWGSHSEIRVRNTNEGHTSPQDSYTVQQPCPALIRPTTCNALNNAISHKKAQAQIHTVMLGTVLTTINQPDPGQTKGANHQSCATSETITRRNKPCLNAIHTACYLNKPDNPLTTCGHHRPAHPCVRCNRGMSLSLPLGNPADIQPQSHPSLKICSHSVPSRYPLDANGTPFPSPPRSYPNMRTI